MIDHIQVNKYSDKILEIIDTREELTRGDLQGAIEAIVMIIIAEIEAEKTRDK